MSKKTRMPRSALKYQPKSERIAQGDARLAPVSPEAESLGPAMEQMAKDLESLNAIYAGSYAGAWLNLQDNIAKTFTDFASAMANMCTVWGVDTSATAEPPPGVSRTTDAPKRKRFECLEV